MESNKPKVLIVDDEKGLRLGTKRLLESEGYLVDDAENGTNGIKLGTSTEYDLAVIDMKMPDIDGLEVLKSIKQKFPHTICFIATAYASYETAIQSTRLGAYSYIPKPFSPDELIHNLRKGFEQRILLLEAEKLKKEREERLLEVAFEKTRLNTIINSIADGVLVVNKEGEVVLYNPSALKFLGLDDLNIEEYCLDKLPKQISDIIKKILGKEEFSSKSYSTQLEIKPRNELFIEAVCSPVPHPDGKIAGVATVISNITELKKVEIIKNQFVSMVAHELKTPVAAVLGFLRIMQDNSLSITETQKNDFLSRSEFRLKGLLDLVNDLLDISRMEMKTKQREIEELDINSILKSIIEMLELEINKRDLKVVLNTTLQIPKIKADNNEITRLFTNLVSNAVKYNVNGGKIFIDIIQIRNYVMVSVKDTGIGMKQEELNNLFNEFYRAKNEKTRGISGTGLGLTIVQRLVDSYAGKIEIESEFGKGTTFKIFLPI